MIEFDNVYKSFGKFHVLKGLDLTLESGKINFVIGRSGSGKSVLLKHILGFIKPDSGNICIDGQDTAGYKEQDWQVLRRRFGMLFQDAALFDFMTVRQNVAFPLIENTRKHSDEINEIVSRKLELVGLKNHDSKLPSELSGGMRKRVAFARAIATDPDFVLFDEPTTGLDPIVCSVIDNLMADAQRELNSTFVVISHDMKATFKIAHKIFMLYNGEIVAQGTPDEIQQTGDPLVRQFIEGHLTGPFEIFY
ncbi:hypothetical protein CHS0354_035309 [Potamilus streckersoni]|uniref:ABC transporter domain-containing protein n=1 Tax=Potamilus streckersoni TaxID=2493646 RepID=A0AAE0S353_9BIVA|nr:hypothetical protein CHS0354_035309 [Potamilus streckersoni]